MKTTDQAARPLLDAEEAARLGRARREKKAGILEEAKAAIAKLGEELDAALRADDGPRVKKVTAALEEARKALELVERAHELAVEDERVAAEKFARLTAEDTERRRQEAVSAKLAEHAQLMEITKRACQEIARAALGMNRVEEELKGLGEKGTASGLHDSRPRHTWQVLQAITERDTFKVIQGLGQTKESTAPAKSAGTTEQNAGIP